MRRFIALLVFPAFLLSNNSVFGAEEKKDIFNQVTNVVQDMAFGKTATSTGEQQAKKLAQNIKMKAPEAVKSRRPAEMPKPRKLVQPSKPQENVAQAKQGNEAAVPAGTEKSKFKQLTKEEYLEFIKGLLDYNPEIMDFVQELKKVTAPENKSYYAYNGTNIADMDVDSLQKLYLRIQNEYVRIRTERINKQMETIWQAQRAAQQAQQVARSAQIPTAPQQILRPPLPPQNPPSLPQVPKPPPQAPVPPRK